MPSNQPEFVQHCLDLLASVGPCVAKRMFGGWGISTGGLTLAIIADLGDGERLWLKADVTTLPTFEAARCELFVYTAKGKPMTLNYRAAPEDAMESPALMRQWATLALDAAVRAHAAKPARTTASKTAKAPKEPKVPRKAAATGKPKTPPKPSSKPVQNR
jgi:DNA transformation protein